MYSKTAIRIVLAGHASGALLMCGLSGCGSDDSTPSSENDSGMESETGSSADANGTAPLDGVAPDGGAGLRDGASDGRSPSDSMAAEDITTFSLDAGTLLEGADGAIHDAATPDSTRPDGAGGDAAKPDGAVAEGSAADGAILDGTLIDGAQHDGAVADAAKPDAAKPDSAVADSAVADSAVADSAVADSAAADGNCGAALATDSLNCGSCGHSCQSGTCSAGKCNPVVLFEPTSGPYAIAVDDTRVFWGESSGDFDVRSVLKDGTDPTVLATKQNRVEGIYVDATNVFWTQAGTNGTIVKADKNGTNQVTLLQSPSGFLGVVADPSWAYATVINDSVARAPRADGYDGGLADGALADAIISGHLTYANGLAQDPNYLYFTTTGNEYGQLGSRIFDGGIPGAVTRWSKDAGLQSVLHLGGAPVCIAVDKNAVYWTDEGLNEILRLPMGATTPVVLASVNEPFCLALDDKYVYFTASNNGSPDGTVERVPLDGSGSTETLATGQFGPAEIAVDDTAIYWADIYSSSIMKLAK